MTLTQNNKKCNREPTEFYKELALVANIVSDWCHHQLLTPTNKPDLVATIILSELLFLHSTTGKIELNNSYDYFRLKFSLSRTKVEATTLNLHNLGLVNRSFVPLQTAKTKGSKFSEELYLKLNFNRILPPDLDAAEAIEDKASGDDLQELYFEEGYSYPEVCLRTPYILGKPIKNWSLPNEYKAQFHYYWPRQLYPELHQTILQIFNKEILPARKL